MNKRGDDLPQSKLTSKDVIEARLLYEEYRDTVKKLESMFSIKSLADRYGIHERTMHKALLGETWSHIP